MCGLASAIAIAQAFPSSSQLDVRITVFELRDVPSTIGGAVNLTPTALRCLDILGVLEELKKRKAGSEVRAIQIFSLHTGSSLGNIDYSGPEGNGFGGYRGWRIARSDLLQALLAVIQKLENVEIVYSKKVVELQESSSAVDVTFEDGTHATGDLVLGCDGIHSSTRMKLVELDRKPTYSGIAAAYGYANVADVFDSDEKRPFFKDTGLTMSRSGALLTTFADDSRHCIYLAALMETKEQDSLEGWRAAGRDQEAVRNEVTRRTRDAELPHIKEMVQSVREWTLYPVYLLPPPGKWHTGRVILLGDAAHAVCHFIFIFNMFSQKQKKDAQKDESCNYWMELPPLMSLSFCRCLQRAKASVMPLRMPSSSPASSNISAFQPRSKLFSLSTRRCEGRQSRMPTEGRQWGGIPGRIAAI
jgi:2-polyprenyl-6-methoxyphenol hydroxylase-like FAD-dependent oxidoreductase